MLGNMRVLHMRMLPLCCSCTQRVRKVRSAEQQGELRGSHGDISPKATYIPNPTGKSPNSQPCSWE